MFSRIKAFFNVHKLMHDGFHGTHMVYFGLVFMEGHGMYAIAGGILAVLTIANWFIHFD